MSRIDEIKERLAAAPRGTYVDDHTSVHNCDMPSGIYVSTQGQWHAYVPSMSGWAVAEFYSGAAGDIEHLLYQLAMMTESNRQANRANRATHAEKNLADEALIERAERDDRTIGALTTANARQAKMIAELDATVSRLRGYADSTKENTKLREHAADLSRALDHANDRLDAITKIVRP